MKCMKFLKILLNNDGLKVNLIYERIIFYGETQKSCGCITRKELLAHF